MIDLKTLSIEQLNNYIDALVDQAQMSGEPILTEQIIGAMAELLLRKTN